MLLPLVDCFYPTLSNSPRAMPIEELTQLVSQQHTNLPIRGNPDPVAALATALASADPDDIVLVTGSLYLVGDLLPTIQEMIRRPTSI